jgi:hypothetical protein
MPAPDVLQDQYVRLQASLGQLDDKVAAKQLELQALQAERQAVRQQVTDLRAAYQAWKGTQL